MRVAFPNTIIGWQSTSIEDHLIREFHQLRLKRSNLLSSKPIVSTLQALLYYITLPLIYLLSLLPFGVLYLISDGVYLLLYRLAGYRRKVVMENLRNSFPQKTDKELSDICKAFYHHLCDLFLETFKTLTITPTEMFRHCRMDEGAQTLLDGLAQKGQTVVLVMGHQGNWEWGGNTFSLACKQKLYVIYHPLSNKYFDGLIYRMRSRFGTGLIPMNDTFREMVKNKGIVHATAFIADQTPGPDNAYWTTFLNQDTPVFWGTERIARKMNYPVVYVQIKKEGRGKYVLHAEMLIQQAKDTKEGEISEIFTRRLEKDIMEQPETWLWSHRRWKHKRKR